MWLSQKMHPLRQNGGVLPAAFLLVVICADYYTKYLAEKFLTTAGDVTFFNSFLKFTLIQNYGGFLGIVNNFSETSRFFFLNVCVALLLLGCLLYLFGFNKRTFRHDIPLAFVTGGGAANLLDRLLHNGGVTDFLSMGIGDFRTGIFNFADVAILGGSFILGYTLFSSPSAEKQPPITTP
ncbi:signal peptidase II [Desulfopila sp. IMCC35006]|uniref:signal peptidase II n=1 Tax=Desulfopila sp. IMCC35006 TaxID=2569542 RepID=UPI0010AC0992|nr:signal peptidase II [Desulfopila sp. IMCC35006]TKB23125.1 signal peptidase II [Desulfopila sp. IMCC35006]